MMVEAIESFLPDRFWARYDKVSETEKLIALNYMCDQIMRILSNDELTPKQRKEEMKRLMVSYFDDAIAYGKCTRMFKRK